MEKPLTIKRAEFTQNLAQAINESKLPAFIVADILKSALEQVQELANAQYQRDMQAYKQACDEQKESEEHGNCNADSEQS